MSCPSPKPRALRILHVETGRFVYGGAQQVLYLIEHLRKEGVESSLLTCADSEMVGKTEALGACVETTPMRGELDLRLLIKAFRLARSGRYDAFHIQSRRGADSLALLGAKLAGITVILSRRVDNREASLLAQARFGLCDRLIAVAAGVRTVLAAMGVASRRVSVVHSAILPERFATPASREALAAEFALPDKAWVIGIAAQLIRRKGHLLLFEALKALRPRFPQLHLIVFGRGPEEADLRTAVEEMELADAVTFAGFRTDLPQWIGALDLVAHPAYTEGLANVLLQAAAGRTAVIATAVGGIPEATGFGTTGILIPVGDSKALEAALVHLLENPRAREAYAAAGPDFVAGGFTPTHLAAGNARVYRGLLSPATGLADRAV